MFKKVFNIAVFTLLIIIISLVATYQAIAQTYSFSEVKEIFLRERPQTGDLSLRDECFYSIDNLILATYPPLNPDTKDFFRFMIKKAQLEIKTEIVTEGATIWQIYNHGFVVKTPSVTMGFDLANYFETTEFVEFANLIDVLFVSHIHGDHYSPELISI